MERTKSGVCMTGVSAPSISRNLAAGQEAHQRFEALFRRSPALRAISELPERHRTVLALYYDEGLTYREIAQVLQVSEPRVCQIHGDAMKRLRVTMTEE